MDRKTIDELYAKGLISHKPRRDLDICEKVTQLVKGGMKNSHAVMKLAHDMRISKRTVYRALKVL